MGRSVLAPCAYIIIIISVLLNRQLGGQLGTGWPVGNRVASWEQGGQLGAGWPVGNRMASVNGMMACSAVSSGSRSDQKS